jgi:hypothetical protein
MLLTRWDLARRSGRLYDGVPIGGEPMVDFVGVESDEVTDLDVRDALFGDEAPYVADACAETAGEGWDVDELVKVGTAIGMVGGHGVVSVLGHGSSG